MAEEETFKNTDPLEELTAKGEDIAKEAKKELEEKAQSETPTGRKSKEAKEAENTQILIGILEPILHGVETAIASKLPEFKHEDEEIETIATLSAPVANKYFDLDAVKYKEEARLLSYLFMCEAPKAKKAMERIRKEAKEKQKKERQKRKRNLKEADKNSDE